MQDIAKFDKNRTTIRLAERGNELRVSGLAYPVRLASVGSGGRLGAALLVCESPNDFHADFLRVEAGSPTGEVQISTGTRSILGG